MARSNKKDVRRPEDWFPPVPYNTATIAGMDAAIAAAVAASFPIPESSVIGLVSDLAGKLNSSAAGTFGLTLLGEATLAAAKISLAYTKADVGLGSVDNTADAAKNVLTATKLFTARNINGVAFDGSADITINAVDATARVPTTRLISTTAPVTGGGDLSADRTIGLSAATTLAAGSMSAADKIKLDAISGTNTGDQTLTSLGILRLIAFFFTTTPTSSEVLCIYVAVDPFTIPANMSSSQVKIGTNPAATFTIDVQQNGSSIGTISISTSGVVTLTTTSGTSKAVGAGDIIKFVAPGTPDTTIVNVAVNIKGTL